jgi:aspartyl protease family protein
MAREFGEDEAAVDRPTRGQGRTLRFALIFFGAFGALCVGLALWAGHEARSILTPTASPPAAKAAKPATPDRVENSPKSAPNRLVYRADRSGHFLIEAAVNGAPVRFLVDTGATLVALTPEDARAAGISSGSLRFSESVSTANGIARVAPTVLRDIRLEQFSLDDVRAVVMEQPMGISLLGMSFLSRLDGYTIRDGQLTLEW